MNKRNIRWFNLIMSVFLLGNVLLLGSCRKDPTFDQGYYIYEDDTFTKVDNVNGIIIHWADDIEISEEQKSVICSLVANMVPVYAGSFIMGAQCVDGQGDNYVPEARENESPLHTVRLGDYYIGKYEITQREWSVVMGYDLEWSDQYGKGDRIPAYYVSWEEANAFVEKLSAMTRLEFRLPTEAQWEFAARGGASSLQNLYSGSNHADEVAWYKGNTGDVLHNVGEKRPNELGLYDMSGSLWEWCADSYRPYSANYSQDPCVMSGSPYVLRGGSWTYLPDYCRVTCRDSYGGDASSLSVGFRVSLTTINN